MEQQELVERKEYQDKLIAIFANMEQIDKLRFWYRYISVIEKEED